MRFAIFEGRKYDLFFRVELIKRLKWLISQIICIFFFIATALIISLGGLVQLDLANVITHTNAAIVKYIEAFAGEPRLQLLIKWNINIIFGNKLHAKNKHLTSAAKR